MDATMQLIRKPSSRKTHFLKIPYDANYKNTNSSCLASFIKIDPLVDATTQLFPLKLMLVDGHVQPNPPNLSYSTISWMLVQS